MKLLEYLVGEDGIVWSILYIFLYAFIGFSIFVLVGSIALLLTFLHPIFAMIVLCIGFLISTYAGVTYLIYLYRVHQLHSSNIDVVINSFFFALSFIGVLWLCIIMVWN